MDHNITPANVCLGTSLSETEASNSKPPQLCPECKELFNRRQELERHILSLHLPCWIACPRCSWRGTRREELVKHSELKCDPTFKKSKRIQYRIYQIYDTKLILGWILDDFVPINTAANFALGFVEERTRELGREEVWAEPWGHKVKEE
ncbi:hypothetical protein BJV74DRAFT_795556 [Russula compacta]|nr:hypothetical protein BJV74DRAFT_795556 [Russula compacta]